MEFLYYEVWLQKVTSTVMPTDCCHNTSTVQIPVMQTALSQNTQFLGT